MHFARRLAPVSLLLAVAAAGGCYQRPPSWEPARVVYEFEGQVRGGEVQLWGHAVADDGDFATSMATRQALAPITEDRNGTRGTAAVANSIEMSVQREPEYGPHGVVPGGCGTSDGFDVVVAVRNFHTVRLTNVHAELTSIRDNTNANTDHSLCNSEATAPNLQVAGTPVSNALGLTRHGNLFADTTALDALPANGILPEPLFTDNTAHAMRWRFRNGSLTANFSFIGRVVADVCADPAGCVPGTIAAPRGVDTNGVVNAVAEGPGVAFIGGDFTRVGPRTGAAFRTIGDATLIGAADPLFPAIEGGDVEVIASDGAGGYYVGGSFTQVGSVAAARLVHLVPDVNGVLNVDGTFNPATVTADGTVQDIEVAGGNVWVGRLTAPFLSVVSATTGAPTLVLSATPTAAIRQITLAGARMIVAGNFVALGGVNNRDKLAVYNPTTGVVEDFTMAVRGGVDREVETFAVVGETLYIGGSFTGVGPGSNNNRTNLAAISFANGGTLLKWAPTANAKVFALVVDGDATTGTVYVGGAFANINTTVARNRIAALPADTSVVTPVPTAFNPGASDIVNALAFDTSARLVVGGQFATLAGQPRNRIGVLNTSNGVALAYDPSVAGAAGTAVRTVLVDGGNYHFGGSFTFGGGSPRNSLAAVNFQTGDLGAFNGGVTGGVVNALATFGSTVYVGGTFTAAGGSPRTRLAAFNGAGTLLPFSPVATDTVRALATDASGVYVGGDFANLVGVGVARFGRVTHAGALDPAFAPPTFNGSVRAVAVDPAGVFVGGDFTAPGTNLVRLQQNGTLVANLNANGSVRGLAVRHQRVYAGGDFTSIAGGSRTRVAAVLLSTNQVDPAFVATGPNAIVNSLAVAGNTVVVGGAFSSRLASFDNVSGATQSFGPLPVADGTAINAVAVIGPVVVAGGQLLATGSAVNTGALTVRRSSLVIAHAE